MTTLAAPPESPSKAVPVTIGGATRQVTYPYSPGMEGVIRSVFGGEYPFLPFLRHTQNP